MYPVVRDRLPRGELGTEDVNSFLSLYSLPNGTVYRALPAARRARPAPAPLPEARPSSSSRPHVDARLGFEIQLPRGWTRLDTAYGVVAVDGTTWDYEASFQVIVRGFGSIDDYLERYGEWHLGRGRIPRRGATAVAGPPARRFALERRTARRRPRGDRRRRRPRRRRALGLPAPSARSVPPVVRGEPRDARDPRRAGRVRDRDYSGEGP